MQRVLAWLNLCGHEAPFVRMLRMRSASLKIHLSIYRFFIPYYPYVDEDMLKDTSAILTVLVLGIAACNLQIWSTITMFSALLDAKTKKKEIHDVDF